MKKKLRLLDLWNGKPGFSSARAKEIAREELEGIMLKDVVPPLPLIQDRKYTQEKTVLEHIQDVIDGKYLEDWAHLTRDEQKSVAWLRYIPALKGKKPSDIKKLYDLPDRIDRAVFFIGARGPFNLFPGNWLYVIGNDRLAAEVERAFRHTEASITSYGVPFDLDNGIAQQFRHQAVYLNECLEGRGKITPLHEASLDG